LVGDGLRALDRRIKVVVAANFIAVAARMSLVSFLGIYYVRDAGIDLATVGVAFLCENLARGFAAPAFGALSDRIGRRPLLLFGVLATAAVLPCFLLVQGPVSLFAWSLALGLVGASSMPVSSALLIDLAGPERRQYVLAVNYTGMSVAYTIGVMPAGFIAEQGYGYLAISSALGYLLVAMLYLWGLRGALPVEQGRGADKLFTSVGSVMKDRVFVRFASLAFIFPLSMGLVVFASPLYASDMGLREGFIGLVLGANSIIVALLAIPVASRIEPMGPFALLGGTGLVIAAALACFALIPHPAAALVAGMVVFSFAELVFSSAVPAAVARLAPAGMRGAYQGGWTLVQSVSNGSALVLSGLLRDAAGWRGAWLLYATLVAAIALILLARKDRFLRLSAEREASETQ
jgi:MFS family permease